MTGIQVTLKIKTPTTETDPFGVQKYTVTDKNVDDVLVGQPSTNDIENALALYGKRVAYTLAIPKGDTNVWQDTMVVLPDPFAGTYRTIGIPTAGIEANVPTRWNKKVLIERFEG